MQKIVHGVRDWFEYLPFMIKYLYFSFLGRDYYIYMEQEPNYWVLVSAEYADNMRYDIKYTVNTFDTLAYYGESFFASGNFDYRLDRYKICSHFETIDRSNPMLIKAIEMYNNIYGKDKNIDIHITTLPDNIPWKIYLSFDYCNEDLFEVVAEPHLEYDINGAGYDNGYKRITKENSQYKGYI